MRTDNSQNTMALKPGHPIAIIRLNDLSQAIRLSEALVEGGITALEFTLTNPAALEVLEPVRHALPDEIQIGIGTVLDAAAALASIDAGAEFLVTPVVVPDVIAVSQSHGIVTICGALTPTEMLMAHRAGAEYIKVFPAGRLGPGYIRDVLAPLPHLKMVCTGGIALDNCRAFLQAGAYSVAIGSSLVDPHLVTAKDWRGLTDRAKKFVDACQGVESNPS